MERCFQWPCNGMILQCGDAYEGNHPADRGELRYVAGAPGSVIVSCRWCPQKSWFCCTQCLGPSPWWKSSCKRSWTCPAHGSLAPGSAHSRSGGGLDPRSLLAAGFILGQQFAQQASRAHAQHAPDNDIGLKIFAQPQRNCSPGLRMVEDGAAASSATTLPAATPPAAMASSSVDSSNVLLMTDGLRTESYIHWLGEVLRLRFSSFSSRSLTVAVWVDAERFSANERLESESELRTLNHNCDWDFDCGATNLLESVFTIAKFIAFAAALFLLLL